MGPCTNANVLTEGPAKMPARTIFPLLIAFLFACLAAVAVLAGFPAKYYGGLLLVVFFGFLLIIKPFVFLLSLFLIRALCDNYFVSIRFTVGAMDMGLGGLFSVFLIGITCLYMVSQRERLKRLKSGTVVFFGLFCLWSLFSAAISADRPGAMKDLISRYSTLSVLIVTLLSIHSEKNAYALFKVIVASALVPLLVGFTRLAIHETTRLEGTFAHANVMAFYLLVVMGLIVFQLYRAEDSKSWSWPVSAYFVILAAGLLLTLTRSSWGAFCAMCGLYVLFFKRKWILPLFILMALVAMTPVVTERLQELFVIKHGALAVNKNTSLSWRLETWSYLWNYALKRPWFGYGINASQWVGRFHIEAHNDYLRFFLESGIIGVVLYFGAYIRAFLDAVKGHRRFRPGSCAKKTAVFLMCYIPAFLLMSASENLARYTTVNFYIMGVLGTYLALGFIEKEKPNDGSA